MSPTIRTAELKLPDKLGPAFTALVKLLNEEPPTMGEVLTLDRESRALYLVTAIKLSALHLTRPAYSYRDQATREPLEDCLSRTMVCERERDRALLEGFAGELHEGGYISHTDGRGRVTFAPNLEVADLRGALAYQEEGGVIRVGVADQRASDFPSPATGAECMSIS